MGWIARIVAVALLCGGVTRAAAGEPQMEGMPGMAPMPAMKMAPPPLGLGMSRWSSGTSWAPDTAQMPGLHLMLGDQWMLMLHGVVFFGEDANSSDRGSSEFISTNWLMAMLSHPLLGGDVTGRAMLSAEPATAHDGYPLLLQSGETLHGQPLHDVQHPHDLFMELALDYRRAVGDLFAFELYGAAAGEPALGPPAFPHRESASSDPLAPIGHHWEDSTHISFGVLTAGVYTRLFKLEGSVFNGREPDENRYDFDFGSLDSWAVRLSANPLRTLSLQVSWGRLAHPEPLEPGQLHRLTASAQYTIPVGDRGSWASTFVFGRNVHADVPSTNAFLIESNLDLDGANTVFGRAEYVQKLGSDLVIPGQEDAVFKTAEVVLGYVHDWWIAPVSIGVGARGSLALVGNGLLPYYGAHVNPCGMLFARIRLVGPNPAM